MVKVMVFNASSGSLKWSLLDADTDALFAEADLPYSAIAADDLGGAVKSMLAAAGDVSAVGYRVVHGGGVFHEPVRVDRATIERIAGFNELAPLHNPVTVTCMRAALEALPGALHVAAFDSTFHRTIPDRAAVYAIPREWTERWGIRRLGFHGLSVEHAVRRTAALLGIVPHRHIVCHLGVGCSATAVLDGESIDTSMGFTPLDGVIMATRSGAIDPGTLLFLVRHGIEVEYFYDTLEHRSGILGVSGVSSDIRDVMDQAARGNAHARLAYEMFIHSVTRVTGGLVAALEGIDALTFTGGVGEHQALVRRDIADGLSYLGVSLDENANLHGAGDRAIGDQGATVQVAVVRSREDLSVLRGVKIFMDRQMQETRSSDQA